MNKVFVITRASEQDPDAEFPDVKCVGVFTSKKDAKQAMAASATREARLQNVGSVIAEVRLSDFSADVIIHINAKESTVIYHYVLSQHIVR